MEKLGFHWKNKAWYNFVLPQKDWSILFGIYCFDEYGNSSGCVAEMTMQWIRHGSEMAPKLNCFYDSFSTLLSPSFTEVMTKLTALPNAQFSQETFIEILLASGFYDLTAYQRTK